MHLGTLSLVCQERSGFQNQFLLNINMKRERLTDNDIRESYRKHLTVGKMAHDLGVPHITLWRKARRIGLTFHGKGGRKLDLKEIIKGKHPQYPTFKLSRRLKAAGILENKCAECDIEEWNGKELVLHLDHINGKSTDHRLENLRLLCPNCHSQTDTYCGRNKRRLT